MLLAILGLALLVAGLAEEVGSSAAVGAFLVGIAISGAAADRARPLLTPLRDLFAAVFFAFLGFQVDPAAIPPVLPAAIVLAVVSAGTKVATGWWSARRAGVGKAGRARAAVALIARGEFSLVIAGLAVAAGIEPELGPLTATYVILLAVGGPLAAKAVDHVAARRAATRLPGGEGGTMSAA
jgi:CPA2 family monovalent cation:H+ antiporter-2